MSKSNGLWSVTFGQFVETLKVLEGHGLTPEHLTEIRKSSARAKEVVDFILESSMTLPDPRRRITYAPPPTERIYEVIVNYNKPLEEMVEAGCYSEARISDFTRKQFPTRKRGVHRVEVELIPVNNCGVNPSVEEATAHLTTLGLRHADVYELAWLGAQYLDLQLIGWIWGLGSFEKNSIKEQLADVRRTARRNRQTVPDLKESDFTPKRVGCYLQGYFVGGKPERTMGINSMRQEYLLAGNYIAAVPVNP